MAETRGPLELGNYLRPSLVLSIPTLVLITGAAFALGAWTRKPILVFILPIVLVLAGFFSSGPGRRAGWTCGSTG
jgi:hypothetical protein